MTSPVADFEDQSGQRQARTCMVRNLILPQKLGTCLFIGTLRILNVDNEFKFKDPVWTRHNPSAVWIWPMGLYCVITA